MDDSNRNQVSRQENGGRGSSRGGADIQGPSRVERGLVRHRAGVVSVATYMPALYLPICPPAYQSPSNTHQELCYFSFLTGRYTIGSSRLEHAPTILRRLQTISRSPRSPSRSSSAALQPWACGLRASAIACASNAQRRRILCVAPRRSPRACPSWRSQGGPRTSGWRSSGSTCLQSVPCGCSLRTSTGGASRPLAMVVVTVVLANVRAYMAQIKHPCMVILLLNLSPWMPQLKVGLLVPL